MHVDVGFLKSERMRSDAPPNVSFIKAIKLNSTPPKMDNWKQHQWDNYTKKQTKKTRDNYTISDAPRHVHQLRPTSFLKKHTHKWLEIDYIWCTPPCSSTGPHKFKRKTHTHKWLEIDYIWRPKFNVSMRQSMSEPPNFWPLINIVGPICAGSFAKNHKTLTIPIRCVSSLVFSIPCVIKETESWKRRKSHKTREKKRRRERTKEESH